MYEIILETFQLLSKHQWQIWGGGVLGACEPPLLQKIILFKDTQDTIWIKSFPLQSIHFLNMHYLIV